MTLREIYFRFISTSLKAEQSFSVFTLSSHALHSASRKHFPLWRTVPLGQKQPSCIVVLQIERSFAMFAGSLSAVDDFIIFSLSSRVLQVSAQPHDL
jgi:hypothetical protein